MNDKEAKGIAIAILLVLGIIFGCIPIYLHHRGILSATGSKGRKMILDIFNCFAGGVFLGTCLLHLMAKGREGFETYKGKVGYENEFPFYEALAGFGVFMVAFVEKLGFALLSKGKRSSENEVSSTDLQVNNGSDPHHQHQQRQPQSSVQGVSNKPGQVETALTVIPEPKSVNGRESTSDGDTATQRDHDHDIHHGLGTSPPCESDNIVKLSVVRAVLLMLALSFHSVFDGLAVGLGTSASSVFEILIAISIHKVLVAFCLGLELAAASPGKLVRPFVLIILFSVISPIGIGIGMGVTSSSVNELAELLVSTILQGLATGVFLYVTFFEILGHQFSHPKYDDENNLCLDVGKVATAVLGFACMGGIKFVHK